MPNAYRNCATRNGANEEVVQKMMLPLIQPAALSINVAIGEVARRHLEYDHAEEVESFEQQHFVDGQHRREIKKKHRHPEQQVLEELKERIQAQISFHTDSMISGQANIPDGFW